MLSFLVLDEDEPSDEEVEDDDEEVEEDELSDEVDVEVSFFSEPPVGVDEEEPERLSVL